MATMNDVALEAGVSRATVSIIVNGRQNERKISAETVQKVKDAIARLNYQPNSSAKKLKDGSSDCLNITLYWPSDYRLLYMERFLHSLLQRISEIEEKCELNIHTFSYQNLEKESLPLINGVCNGAILVGLSEKDVDYLEQLSLQIPIVMVNRNSEKYSTVSFNHVMIAEKAARLVAQKGYREAALLSSNETAAFSHRRTALFQQFGLEYGIHIPPEFDIRAENSMQGGADAAKCFLSLPHRHKVLFCDYDYMAIGFMNYCHKMHFSIPEELEILTIGMLNPSFSAFCTPSLSNISLPIEDLAVGSLDQLIADINAHSLEPVHQVFNPRIYLADTFQPLQEQQ